MKIGLIPLDERPACARYPQMIGDIAGVKLLLPPATALSRIREPGDCPAIAGWLRENASELDALVVSIEMLVYGGLTASRISDDATVALLNRLECLRELKQGHPHLRIYGFNLITRISGDPDSVAEPDYWSESGPQIYRYSQAYDARRWGNEPAPQREQLNESHLLDVLRRRLRNHIVNLAVLDLLAENVFDLLVISSDDTSEYGFGTREKIWVQEWVDRRGGDERLLVYPGADEVASALLARAFVDFLDQAPRFFTHYAIEADKERTAPFEDGPVCLTLERQIRAVGGTEVDDIDAADMIVAVNPPAPGARSFFQPDRAESDRNYRQGALADLAERIGCWLDEGRRVIVCDLAYPNGSDPVLIEALQQKIRLRDLAAYGGWNTAGNTIGVALAQGIAQLREFNEKAALRFLTHRFAEDYCFMHQVRPTMNVDMPRYDDKTEAAMIELVSRALNEQIRQLSGLGAWQVSNVRLPMKRRFEVDFELERL
ncbi:MAG: DUF4127 family protein [Chloroflexi bacterium]|nr:DUF4127 family protein [Chloroflexota bacterium]